MIFTPLVEMDLYAFAKANKIKKFVSLKRTLFSKKQKREPNAIVHLTLV